MVDTREDIFAVSLLEGEIYNGGFDRYFNNSSADYYPFAMQGLSDMDAANSLALTAEAADILFGRSGPPATQAGRQKIMNSRARRLSDILSQRSRASRLDDLDKRFYDNPDELVDRLTAYAEEHGLVQPFEKQEE